jgi:hypothetical protein
MNAGIFDELPKAKALQQLEDYSQSDELECPLVKSLLNFHFLRANARDVPPEGDIPPLSRRREAEVA